MIWISEYPSYFHIQTSIMNLHSPQFSPLKAILAFSPFCAAIQQGAFSPPMNQGAKQQIGWSDQVHLNMCQDHGFNKLLGNVMICFSCAFMCGRWFAIKNNRTSELVMLVAAVVDVSNSLGVYMYGSSNLDVRISILISPTVYVFMLGTW